MDSLEILFNHRSCPLRDPLQLRAGNTSILGRCLSLMGISGPYEDTLNSEAKEGIG